MNTNIAIKNYEDQYAFYYLKNSKAIMAMVFQK